MQQKFGDGVLVLKLLFCHGQPSLFPKVTESQLRAVHCQLSKVKTCQKKPIDMSFLEKQPVAHDKKWLTNLSCHTQLKMYVPHTHTHTHDVLVFYSSGLIAILLLFDCHKHFTVYLFSNNSTKSHSSAIKFLPKRTFFQNACTLKCFNSQLFLVKILT